MGIQSKTLSTPQTARKPIFIVDPAVHTCELDCFNACVKRAPSTADFRYFAPARFGTEDLLATEEKPSAIIMLGSGASVYDELPWQGPLHAWTEKQMSSGVPTLGICYGHQLIAHLFGGRIELGFQGRKKRGCRDISLHTALRLASVQPVGSTIVSHKEIVVDSGALEIVASSVEVEIEAVQHRVLPIWGFQAHIEATPAFLRNNDIPLDNPAHEPEFGFALINAFINHALHERHADLKT